MLRESEELAQLYTEVSAELSALEHTLSAGNARSSAESRSLLDGVAALQRRLCLKGEMFCKRLQGFLDGTRCEQQHNALWRRLPSQTNKAGLGNLHHWKVFQSC